MFRTGYFVRNLLATMCAWLLVLPSASFAGPVTPAEPKAAAAQDAVSKEATANGIVGQLTVTVGKSLTIDSPLAIKRLSTANGALAVATGISPKEILINGLAPGETTLIIWQEDGTRLIYDLTVRMSPQRLNEVRQQIARDYPEAEINVTFGNESAFVRGTVKDVIMADRVMAIVRTMSPSAVNLLRVDVPPVEPQIMLKVRFANIDRSAKFALGASFTQPIGSGSVTGAASAVAGAVNSAINTFALGAKLNLLGTIQALEDKNLLEMLAEPNLLTFSGKRASFTAGGEFPYLAPQPSASGVTYSIEFKEWGVRLNFLPRVTPQGTIHMEVNPEVSALDFANGVALGGTVVPGLTVRKVTTEVDLESGQTFVIAGLLDKQITQTLSRIPGLGDIPVLGKLFQSKTITKSNSELLIMITPEIVRPIPAQQMVPELKWTVPFMTNNSDFPMRQPGMDITGTVPVHPPTATLPLEQLVELQAKPGQASTSASTPVVAPPAAPPAGPGGGANPASGGGAGIAK